MAPYTDHMVHRVDPPRQDFVQMERSVAARSGRSHRKSPRRCGTAAPKIADGAITPIDGLIVLI